MTTLQNKIWIPDAAKVPADLHTTPTVMMAAAMHAIGASPNDPRPPLSLSVADATERDALPALLKGGMRPADRVYNRALHAWDESGPEGWRTYENLISTDFIPDWTGTGVALGNGQTGLQYWVKGDRVTVQGIVGFGTSSSFLGGGTSLLFPFPIPIRMGYANARVLGPALAAFGSDRYQGVVTHEEDTLFPHARIAFEGNSGAAGALTPWQSTYPFAWAGGGSKWLSVKFNYIRA